MIYFSQYSFFNQLEPTNHYRAKNRCANRQEDVEGQFFVGVEQSEYLLRVGWQNDCKRHCTNED